MSVCQMHKQNGIFLVYFMVEKLKVQIFYTFDQKYSKKEQQKNLAGHCGLEHVAQGYTPPFPSEHPGSCDFGKSQSHQSAAADPPAGESEPLSEQLASPTHTNTQSCFMFLNEVSPKLHLQQYCEILLYI